jgi:voltage-gated potassium channel
MRARSRRHSGERATHGAALLVKAVLVDILLVTVATVIYYLVPVPSRMREDSWAVLFGCGVVVLAILILAAIRRLLGAGENARIRGLILLLVLSVLFFSYADESVARLPGQFAGLHTKTDSLYFNVSTLSTVGFGDVHAVGQLARAAVILQIIFNLVFLGLAVSIITGFMRTRARRRLPVPEATHRPEPGEAAGPR